MHQRNRALAYRENTKNPVHRALISLIPAHNLIFGQNTFLQTMSESHRCSHFLAAISVSQPLFSDFCENYFDAHCHLHADATMNSALQIGKKGKSVHTISYHPQIIAQYCNSAYLQLLWFEYFANVSILCERKMPQCSSYASCLVYCAKCARDIWENAMTKLTNKWLSKQWISNHRLHASHQT